jgi:hypothetical protein
VRNWFGITTNSVVAAIEGGQPSVIINAMKFTNNTFNLAAYTRKTKSGKTDCKTTNVINPEIRFSQLTWFIGSKESEFNRSKTITYQVTKFEEWYVKLSVLL